MDTIINDEKLINISPEISNDLMENNVISKEYIKIPKGVRYIGEAEWNDENRYKLSNYPFPHILNKVLTGCGFTEYCISNEQDTIVCSPRRLLLENKDEQHPEINVFYAKNDIEKSVNFERTLNQVDGRREANRFIRATSTSLSVKKLKPLTPEEIEERKRRILELKNKIKNHYWLCKSKNLPCKILVTYDSFRHVKEALHEVGVLSNFQIVIDEFQSILVDCKFKSDTEMELLNHLSGLQKVCYVSATPMLDKYLKKLDEFKDLPYYELDWGTEDPGRIIKPVIRTTLSSNITTDIIRVIHSYKDGKFEKDCKRNDQGLIEEVESKEAVLYVNSVSIICTIITKCELLPEECNILVAKTQDNETKLRKSFNAVFKKLGLKRKFGVKDKIIGTVPVKGQSHKMFTFCTRTVYLGADFYSTCARTFIFSDSNIDCLCVDISMDLPQILGRQRLIENPWKNTANIYIKTTMAKWTREDFEENVKSKVAMTNDVLYSFSLIPKERRASVARLYKIASIRSSYNENYMAVNVHAGNNLVPVFNKLVLVAEERAYDIQQQDYADRVSIFNTLYGKGYHITDISSDLDFFNSITHYDKKMEFICIYGQDPSKTKEQFELLLSSVPKSFKNYFTVLGPDKCKAHKYRKSDMEKEYQRLLNNQGVSLDDRIYDTFHAGERHSYTTLKTKLEKIYQDSNFQQTAKATDIKTWFVTKPIKMKDESGTGKRENGLELISRVTPPTP